MSNSLLELMGVFSMAARADRRFFSPGVAISAGVRRSKLDPAKRGHMLVAKGKMLRTNETFRTWTYPRIFRCTHVRDEESFKARGGLLMILDRNPFSLLV
ncbi:hypothetical protein EVG20_g7786 [Dentipellis fragilis]|uniref:Uncharacterized protein n=1 Tax=Dentipellis fragilis TaxID=205917 RepID=A0A4Y9YAW0_9AGAM|nr:hypothetical protein EVG20_g7786 [Dentipellis fragilis]